MKQMKHLTIAITLLSGTLLAQSSFTPAGVGSKGSGPNYSQLYCSGFVTRQAVPRTNFVLGAKESPHEDQFSGRTQLFLGGPALVEGQRYSLLRQADDPNREDSAAEQRKKLARLGALYQEVGWVTVRSVEKGAAVATFDFSCDTAIPGDVVVPFQEKPAIAFRTTDIQLAAFQGSPNAVRGSILGSKDFDGLLGTGQIVYTDFGGNKGIKPGDYLLVLRGYAPGDLNRIDRASERLPKGADPSAVRQAKIAPDADQRIPKRVLGEVLVLSTTPESSTALITRAFSEMELGDVLQAEDGSASAEQSREAIGEPAPCQPASHLRRMLLLGHGCKAAAPAQ